MRAKKRKLSGITAEFIKKGAEGITDDHITKVTEKAADIRAKFSHSSPLGRFLDDLQLLLSLVSDYWSGDYRKVPYGTITAVVFSLLYVPNPFDIIPDVLPVVGYLDDAAVIALCLNFVEQDLLEYKRWKES